MSSGPDNRPTPARGMHAIRTALGELNGTSDDVAVLRRVVGEVVLVQDEQGQAISEVKTQVASNTVAIGLLQEQQRMLVASEKERNRAVAGLRKSFANNILRMRRIAKDQHLIARAINSPKIVRSVTLGVALGTIIATLLSKAC